jgi:hypothetical protein
MTIIMPMLPLLQLPISSLEFIKHAAPDMMHHETAGCDDFSDKSWSHPLLGTFSRNAENLCKTGTLRRRSCCRPNQPKHIRYRFLVDNSDEVIATRDFRSHTLSDAIALDNKPVVWFIPSMLSDDFVVEDAMDLSEAFIKKGYTVVLLDWDEIEKGFGQSIANTRVLAEMVAHLMHQSGTIDRSLCVGFSFGAHVCGMASKRLKHKSGKKIPRCHLLDPAGPGFELTPGAGTHLENGDCEVMIAVHTTHVTMSNTPVSILHNNGFGTMLRHADCSFEVNGASAYDQPGCADLQKLNKMIRRKNKEPFIRRGPPAQRCGHARALSMYLSSVEKRCTIHGQSGLKKMRFPPFDDCKAGMKQEFSVNTTMGIKPYC